VALGFSIQIIVLESSMMHSGVQIDFFGENPPGEATRYIVGRYTKKLLE